MPVLAVTKERRAGETRVAVTPDAVKKLIVLGFEVVVEAGAGLGAAAQDADYAAAGARVVATPAEALSTADLRKLLPDSRTVLIEYLVSSDLDTTVLAIARGEAGGLSITARKLPFRQAQLEKRVEDFRRSLATRDLSYREQAKSLYKDLLGPVHAALADRSLVGIVPDGPLWNLPFQALIATDGEYLVEHAAVFYAPSLTTLHGRLAG